MPDSWMSDDEYEKLGASLHTTLEHRSDCFFYFLEKMKREGVVVAHKEAETAIAQGYVPPAEFLAIVFYDPNGHAPDDANWLRCVKISLSKYASFNIYGFDTFGYDNQCGVWTIGHIPKHEHAEFINDHYGIIADKDCIVHGWAIKTGRSFKYSLVERAGSFPITTTFNEKVIQAIVDDRESDDSECDDDEEDD